MTVIATLDPKRSDTACTRDLFLGQWQEFDLFAALGELHVDHNGGTPATRLIVLDTANPEEQRFTGGHNAHWAAIYLVEQENLSFYGETRVAFHRALERYRGICPKLIDEFIAEVKAADIIRAEKERLREHLERELTNFDGLAVSMVTVDEANKITEAFFDDVPALNEYRNTIVELPKVKANKKKKP